MHVVMIIFRKCLQRKAQSLSNADGFLLLMNTSSFFPSSVLPGEYNNKKGLSTHRAGPVHLGVYGTDTQSKLFSFSN